MTSTTASFYAAAAPDGSVTAPSTFDGAGSVAGATVTTGLGRSNNRKVSFFSKFKKTGSSGGGGGKRKKLITSSDVSGGVGTGTSSASVSSGGTTKKQQRDAFHKQLVAVKAQSEQQGQQQHQRTPQGYSVAGSSTSTRLHANRARATETVTNAAAAAPAAGTTAMVVSSGDVQIDGVGVVSDSKLSSDSTSDWNAGGVNEESTVDAAAVQSIASSNQLQNQAAQQQQATQHHKSTKSTLSSMTTNTSTLYGPSSDGGQSTGPNQRTATARSQETTPSEASSSRYESAANGAEGITNSDDDAASKRKRKRRIRRYRGFLTSISDLFGEERLVCGAVSCFGLLLSNRTEHLLHSHRNNGTALTALASNGKSSRQSRIGANNGDDVLLEDAAARAHGASTRRPNHLLGIWLFLVVVMVSASYLIFPPLPIKLNREEMFGGDDFGSIFHDDYYEAVNKMDDDAHDVDDYFNNRRVTEDFGWSSRHSRGAILTLREFSILPLPWDKAREDLDLVDLYDPGFPYNSQYRGYDVENYTENEEQEEGQNIGPIIRASLIISFFVLLGTYGRQNRVKTRKLILQNRYRDDMADNSGDVEVLGKAHEGRYMGGCAHTLCGCYPADPPFLPEESGNKARNDEDTEVEDMDDDEDETGYFVDQHGVRRAYRKVDCCQWLFKCFSACCCGCIWPCKCYCQCLSACALAQEAREVYALIGRGNEQGQNSNSHLFLPSTVNVDYITHEPWSDYLPGLVEVERARRDNEASALAHFPAMSRLSRGLWGLFIFAIVAVIALMMLSARYIFTVANAFVLIATFFQSFFILYVVHRIYSKSYLSVDAMTKFFSAGFLLAVPTAFVLESVIVNFVLFVTLVLYEMSSLLGVPVAQFLVQNRDVFMVVAELINAFVVAAATEELTKYYMFRMVDHPDLPFMNDVGGSHTDAPVTSGGTTNKQSTGGVHGNGNGGEGGSQKTFVAAHDPNREGGGDAEDSTVTASYQHQQHVSNQFNQIQQQGPYRTNRQKAAAVTIAMLSVAVGLACAENVLYVYYLSDTESADNGNGGKSASQQFMTLVFRSIFPIHAICAAMQSIGVIRRFIERDTIGSSIGVGRTILPALMLHGCFDAVLMVTSVFLQPLEGDNSEGNNDDGVGGEDVNYNEDGSSKRQMWINIIAWFGVISVTIAGTVWYFWQKAKQKARLKIMDAQEAIDRGQTVTNDSTSYSYTSTESEAISNGDGASGRRSGSRSGGSNKKYVNPGIV